MSRSPLPTNRTHSLSCLQSRLTSFNQLTSFLSIEIDRKLISFLLVKSLITSFFSYISSFFFYFQSKQNNNNILRFPSYCLTLHEKIFALFIKPTSILYAFVKENKMFIPIPFNVISLYRKTFIGYFIFSVYFMWGPRFLIKPIWNIYTKYLFIKYFFVTQTLFKVKEVKKYVLLS